MSGCCVLVTLAQFLFHIMTWTDCETAYAYSIPTDKAKTTAQSNEAQQSPCVRGFPDGELGISGKIIMNMGMIFAYMYLVVQSAETRTAPMHR